MIRRLLPPPVLWLIVLITLIRGAAIGKAADRHVAVARRGMLATVHPMATQAGVEAFHAGGNAVDAAISAAVMLGVVDSHNSGLGGGCFILIRSADGRQTAIDAREVAPAAASRDMYMRDGLAVPELSQTGPLAVAIPGAVAGYHAALERFGKLDSQTPWLKAARVAAEGFAIDTRFANALTSVHKDLQKFPASASTFLHADGTPLRAGELLRQPDLATVCSGIAEHGPEYFYHGPVADQIGNWMQANGGLVTAQDFAAYRIVDRQPLVTTYRQWTIVGFPPPSSGGVHVAQMLNILENFDLRRLHQQNSLDVEHVLAESMKLAFADRAYWLGDPQYANVPRGLIDKSYARELASRISLSEAGRVLSHGQPPRADSDLFEKHTTHVAAADAEGNWVAITQTVNTTFGSKVVVPGTGFVLNNEMDDFSSQPGVPNAFGLIGAEANSIAPGKRPLSSMSPTMILSNGQPIMTVGAAGGPKIITQTLQAIVRHLDLNMPLGEAVGAPRIHHQWSPDILMIENSAPDSVFEGLRSRGHNVQRLGYTGVTQAIVRDQSGRLIGVHDPRVEGQAAGLD